MNEYMDMDYYLHSKMNTVLVLFNFIYHIQQIFQPLLCICVRSVMNITPILYGEKFMLMLLLESKVNKKSYEIVINRKY